MNQRNFENWFSTIRDTLDSDKFIVEGRKVYFNYDKIKSDAKLLNQLIYAEDIENKYRDLMISNPNLIKLMPMIIEKREDDLCSINNKSSYVQYYGNTNASIDDYVNFMDESGLFYLLQEGLINDMETYLFNNACVELTYGDYLKKGLSSKKFELIIEAYIEKAGFIKNKTYFKDLKLKDLSKIIDIKLPSEVVDIEDDHRFDFLIYSNGKIYICDCNFLDKDSTKVIYNIKHYSELSKLYKGKPNVNLMFFLDGKAVKSHKKQLESNENLFENLYNVSNLEDDIFSKLL